MYRYNISSKIEKWRSALWALKPLIPTRQPYNTRVCYKTAIAVRLHKHQYLRDEQNLPGCPGAPSSHTNPSADWYLKVWRESKWIAKQTGSELQVIALCNANTHLCSWWASISVPIGWGGCWGSVVAQRNGGTGRKHEREKLAQTLLYDSTRPHSLPAHAHHQVSAHPGLLHRNPAHTNTYFIQICVDLG